MTAVTAHRQTIPGLPSHAGTGDRRPIVWALAGALALHLAALGIPLPKTPQLQERPRTAPTFELGTFDIVPPIVSPPPPTVSTERPRRVEVPFAVPEGLTDPVAEQPLPIDPGEVSAPAGFLGLDDGPGPPPAAPSVYPEGTRDLILPLRQPGGAEVAYPRMARLARQPGRVVLRAVITETGAIDRIEVLHASEPDLGFTGAAIEAVSGWRYEPGTLDGRPVAVALTVVVEFSLR